MNLTSYLDANLQINLETMKGVALYWQQEGGHGSRNPLRKV